MKTIESPKIEKSTSSVGDTVESHPAYAMIGASRVSTSGGAYLYGSDFAHQQYITICIRRSELHRGLSRDWPFGREELIEVALSEAQWASFVSSMNVGSGVQCTIEHVNCVTAPGLPAAEKRQEQFSRELKETLADASAALKALRQSICDTPMSEKARKALLSNLVQAENNLAPNVDFVASQFSEHMENVTQHAKIEVNAYVTGMLVRTGLDALGVKPPLTLEAA